MAKTLKFEWMLVSSRGEVIAVSRYGAGLFQARDHLDKTEFPGFPFYIYSVSRQEVVVMTEWYEQPTIAQRLEDEANAEREAA